MKKIKYILVYEKNRKKHSCNVTYRDVPYIGHCCYVSSPDIKKLVRLRLHHPDAKILGVSELDTSASYASVRVNPMMNELRRVLSDLP